jgi:hypothetical protein
MEEAARVRAHAGERVEVGAGPRLGAGVAAQRLGRGERAQALDALGQHDGIALVGEEAVIDLQRRARVGPGDPDRPARRGFHREDGRARLISGLARGVERGEEEQVAQAGGAGRARERDGHLCHEERERLLVGGGLAPEQLGAHEAEADADVVAQPFADRQPALRADAAAQQDPRRAVGARRQDDRGRVQLAALCRDADRAVAVEQHPVDQRVRDDRQAVAVADRVEVGR